MSKEKEATTGTKHRFEHLGQPPYRFLYHEAKTYQACPGAPIQVGGSCDHCATGIIDQYHFESADGKRFKVGSSCVRKAGSAGMYSQIKNKVNKVKRERKAKRDAERIAAAVEKLEVVRPELEAKPHPRKFVDRETGEDLTLADWCDWMLRCAGTRGKLDVAKVIEKEEEQSNYVTRESGLKVRWK